MTTLSILRRKQECYCIHFNNIDQFILKKTYLKIYLHIVKRIKSHVLVHRVHKQYL
jgi:hypothetical protein